MKGSFPWVQTVDLCDVISELILFVGRVSSGFALNFDTALDWGEQWHT
jgi:hypothetical protein